MYIVKKNNRKVTLKMFSTPFTSYDVARNTLRKYLRSLGLGRNLGNTGYSIVKT
jgi:hypothetical protein